MSIGSGLSGSFGWSKQSSAYATREAPAKFIRHRSCEFMPVLNRVQGEGIQSGALGPRSDQHVQTHQGATASVEFDVTTLNMVQLMEAIMGGSSSAQQGGTAAYLHTFTLQDPTTAVARGLTLQQNVALRAGTDKCKEVVGARATSATFSIGRGEILTGSVEFDGYKYDDAQTLASPSYVSGVPFKFDEAALKLGTYSSESSVTGVRAFSCTINRPQDTESYGFGAAGYKVAPVLNGLTEISGSIEADYIAVADFEDRYLDKTYPSLVFECVGTVASGKAAIATTYFNTFRITLPGVHIEGAVNNSGYAETSNSWNYSWVYDGTNLPSIQVMSSETSV